MSLVHRSHRVAGFTLIELVVAIGVVALLGLGIAAIFGAVGQTVATGRKVSATTEAAAAFERRMRADLESITRDGFLIIRNEWANNGEPVQVTPDDLSPRPRRVDELMFFARGEFTTARQPLLNGVDVRAGAAKIYYGHGQSLPIEPDPGTGDWPYGQPYVSTAISSLADPASRDINDSGNLFAASQLALGDSSNAANPNRYASDWMLLRDVVLLRSPSVQSRATLNTYGDGLNSLYGISFSDSELADSDIQVNLQPAARSVFRSVNRLTRDEFGRSESTVRPETAISGGFASSLPIPSLESGLVDIATTDLNEIKTIVTQSAYATSANNSGFQLLFPSHVYEQELGNSVETLPGSEARIDASRAIRQLAPLQTAEQLAQRRINDPATPASVNVSLAAPVTQIVIDAQHAWMADALPGFSSEQQFNVQPPNVGSTNAPQSVRIQERARDGVTNSLGYQTRSRRRFEPTPPAFYRNLADPPSGGASGIDAAIFRADKAMLTASNFGVMCTEFIVEWSFGELAFNAQDNDPDYIDGQATDTRGFTSDGIEVEPGNVVWYGAERFRDPNADDEFEPLAAHPVFRDTDGIRRANWRTNLADLIHGRVFSRPNNPGGFVPPLENTRRPTIGDNRFSIDAYRERPLTSYFGYADPRGVDTDGDGVANSDWPWPKYIRVTATFADPNNPIDEETVQFIVEVPANDGF